jgi:hypothetical protein
MLDGAFTAKTEVDETAHGIGDVGNWTFAWQKTVENWN